MSKTSSLAVGGYDAVSYFEEGRPRAGKFEYKTQHQGLTFAFHSENNLKQFLKDKDRYAPQFGGDCAFGWGLFGGSREGSPQCWRIVAGKLYFSANPVVGAMWRYFPFLIGRGHSKYTEHLRQRHIRGNR